MALVERVLAVLGLVVIAEVVVIGLWYLCIRAARDSFTDPDERNDDLGR